MLNNLRQEIENFHKAAQENSFDETHSWNLKDPLNACRGNKP